MANKRLFRPGDLVALLACLTLTGLLFVLQLTRDVGDRVRIQTPQGEQVLLLSENTQYTFDGRDGLTVTVAVQDGQVRVMHADCPDQVCVHTGAIGSRGGSIACLPAGIVLTVDADRKDAPDAVTR